MQNKTAQESSVVLQQIIEEVLQAINLPSSPSTLYEPFSYMLNLGGKRFRPVLTLLACQSMGMNYSKAMPQAIAIELFHNFTLIHDDIMDHALLRRGFPTIHQKFGGTAAILSGDVMLVYAYHYLMQCDESLLQILVNKFNECAVNVCEGQQLDMDFENRIEVSMNEYLKMISCKTASLIATALEIGALVGGAEESVAKHFFEFGKNLGIAFQMRDDWLDSFGNAEKFGKKRGGDILQKKKTTLYVTAMEMGSYSDQKKLRDFFSEEKISDHQLNEILDMYDSSGVKQITLERMNEFYESAMNHLHFLSASVNYEQLESLAASLFQRDH